MPLGINRRRRGAVVLDLLALTNGNGSLRLPVRRFFRKVAPLAR
jgi:hypothetical protein